MYTRECKDGEINGQGTEYIIDKPCWTEECEIEYKIGSRTVYYIDDTALRMGECVDDECQIYRGLAEIRYEGKYRDNKKNGHGTYYYEDGSRYEGEWKDGNRHGKGVFYYAVEGDRYEGEYRDDKLEGQGTYYWAYGRKYTGEFKDGEINGQGTKYYADGSKWTGEWKNGTENGSGTEYAADGTVLRSGNWVDGKYVEPE